MLKPRTMCAVLALLVTGCGENPVDTSEPRAVTLARATGTLVVQEVAAMRAAEGGLAGWGAAGPSPAAGAALQYGSCAYSLLDSQWKCSVTGTGGASLSGDATLEFFDVRGQRGPLFSDTETASVRLRWNLQGHSAAGWKVQTAHDYTVSGLLGSEVLRTWNGTGATTGSTLTMVVGGVATDTYTSRSQVQALTFRQPREANPWPQSGTVTYSVELSDGSRRIGGTATVTFRGGTRATVTLEGRPFTVDLETGAVSRG